MYSARSSLTKLLKCNVRSFNFLSTLTSNSSIPAAQLRIKNNLGAASVITSEKPHFTSRRLIASDMQIKKGTNIAEMAYTVFEQRMPVFPGRKKGPTVILLHGLFGNQKNWMPFARAMNQEQVSQVDVRYYFKFNVSRQIFTADLRNHGHAEWCKTMSYQEMADDLAYFLDELGLKRAAFMGHSLGGKVALTFALRYPQRVSRLMIVDTGPGKSPYHMQMYEEYLDAMESIKLNDPHSTVAQMRKATDLALKDIVPDPRTRNFLVTSIVEDEMAISAMPLYRWQFNIKAIHADLRNILDFPKECLDLKCDAPTLFLKGSDSNYLSEENFSLAYLQTMFPNAKIHEIPNTGHWVHIDNPKEFLDVVIPFLMN